MCMCVRIVCRPICARQGVRTMYVTVSPGGTRAMLSSAPSNPACITPSARQALLTCFASSHTTQDRQLVHHEMHESFARLPLAQEQDCRNREHDGPQYFAHSDAAHMLECAFRCSNQLGCKLCHAHAVPALLPDHAIHWTQSSNEANNKI